MTMERRGKHKDTKHRPIDIGRHTHRQTHDDADMRDKRKSSSQIGWYTDLDEQAYTRVWMNRETDEEANATFKPSEMYPVF